MEQQLRKCATVRLVDIEKEILKGKKVKPGILDDDIQPGPSKRAKVATHILPNPRQLQAYLPASASGSVIPNSVPDEPLITNLLQPTIVQPEDEISCGNAEEAPMPSLVWNNSQILREKFVTQSVPVDKMWSEIKSGVRFIHPSNLDQNVITKVSDTLKTKASSLKNTIISLPNSVYLVPLSCFKGAQLPPDSLVSLASNDRVNKVAVVEATKEIEEKEVLKHPCWNLKRNRKLDLEGFTAYDRLGFYKAEVMRAKKCQRCVQVIIDNLRQSMLSSKEEFAMLKYESLGKSAGKLKCLPEKTSDPESQNTKMTTASKLRSQEAVYCIDHTNFEKFHLHRSCIFVNKNSVVTEIILKTFPNFKAAVDSGAVKIVSEKKSGEKEPLVQQDAHKLMRFVKFLRDSHNLLDVMNEHSYAANENSMCIHNSDELLKPKRKNVIDD